MKATLFLSSFLCLALLIYAPIDTFLLQEYHEHQKAYRARMLEMAETDEERVLAAAYAIEPRQVVLPELQRVDRCVSCHVALEDPRMKDAENPLKAHPGAYLADHDIRKIGCTVCHDGQGRALLSVDAHATTGGWWDKPLLKPPFLQANCMRCHDSGELPGLEIVNRGEQIFLSQGCLGCHLMRGRGGQLGPDLTNIADASPHIKYPVKLSREEIEESLHGNVNLAYIYESAKYPMAQPLDTAMVDFQFTDEEALALTVYLKGCSKREIPGAYLASREQQKRQTRGLEGVKLFDMYCIGCHGEGGQGGVENPNYAKETIPALNTLAEKMFIEYEEDAEYVAELLVDGEDLVNMPAPEDFPGWARVVAQYVAITDVMKKGSTAARADPDGPMPPRHMPSWASEFTETEINTILAYLLEQFPWEEEWEDEEKEEDL